jgi:hypothetical protein
LISNNRSYSSTNNKQKKNTLFKIMGTIKIYGTFKSGTSSWHEITGTPTTLAGYGITDAAPISLDTFVRANSSTWDGSGVSIATVAAASAAAVTEANSYTDTAVSGKAAASHTHVTSEVTGLDTKLTALSSAIDGKQASGSYAAASHTHVTSEVTGLDTKLTALSSAIDGKQASGSYAAASHTHDVTEVTNAASVSLVATASAAAVTSANSYADNKFIPAAGGTITGSLSVLGNLTYIDTSVAVTSAMYIDTASSETALRVTQSGPGDAIRVEDSANPDTTPFIVKSDGLVGVGTASPNEKLTVAGNVSATGSYYGDGSNLTGITGSGNAGVNTWVQTNSANPTFTVITADAYRVTSSSINAQVGTSYTLVAGDNGKVVTLNNASAITVAVPSGLGAGFSCSLIQLGAGQVSLSAGAGVTLNSYLGYTKIGGQHGGASLISYSANIFNLNGNLAS